MKLPTHDTILNSSISPYLPILPTTNTHPPVVLREPEAKVNNPSLNHVEGGLVFTLLLNS